ncbi:GNAT family N-acetyltransferase [Butyrivibrio sp. AE2032]|uniref:GNAT family N-acetyltransferase n=1 Tax=Butyrivibrio sp. AE2032 TaxID=1458463 RepID=UPI0005509E3A|nr:GNAT family N-acetyltransferase [Butyrivibrio sp. AE2032]
MSSIEDRVFLPDSLGERNSKGFRVIYGKQVSPQNIRSALEIDYLSYDDLYHLDLERCIEYHKKNPLIYIMAVNDSDEVVGYVNFSPVTDKIYEVMRSGRSVDTIISAEDILAYETGREYSVYFSSVCVRPEYRRKGIAGLLIESLIELLKSIDNEGVYIKRIVADAVTESGERLLSNLGYEVVCLSEHGSKIMEKVNDG